MYAKITRKLDEFGRFVIPKGILRMYDISPKDSVEFFIDDKANTISLKKNEEYCTFCKSTNELSHFRGSLICKTCAFILTGLTTDPTGSDMEGK